MSYLHHHEFLRVCEVALGGDVLQNDTAENMTCIFRSLVSNMCYLHHLEFLRVCEVALGGDVLQNVTADVDVRPVHEALLDVHQQLTCHVLKRSQLRSYNRKREKCMYCFVT